MHCTMVGPLCLGLAWATAEAVRPVQTGAGLRPYYGFESTIAVLSAALYNIATCVLRAPGHTMPHGVQKMGKCNRPFRTGCHSQHAVCLA